MTATATRRRKASGITLDRATLFGALEAVGAAVPARSPKPILSNVLLKDGTICGSDLEIQVQTECEWHDDPVVLPFARLRSILKESAGDEVTLSVDGTGAMKAAADDVAHSPRRMASCGGVPGGEPAGLPPAAAAASAPAPPRAAFSMVCRLPCRSRAAVNVCALARGRWRDGEK